MTLFFAAARAGRAAGARLGSFVRAWGLRLLGVRVGRGVVFGGPVRWKFNGRPERVEIGDRVVFGGRVDLRNRENGRIVIEEDCFFDDNVRLVAAREATLRVGARTATGRDLVVNAGADVTIGPDCLFSSAINIYGGTHRVAPGSPIRTQGYHPEPTTIGGDVWLAGGVNVLSHSRLGDGLVVGPNAVLCGEYPAGAIVAGNPARVVGRRGEDCPDLRLMTRSLGAGAEPPAP